MSRKPPVSTDKAAQNQQTLKTLVKIESNKSCADCKKNKHPRWASWNLGIFVCIRCSGIHRGMGTHISRVKSVDLDAWTDEQLQSMIKWGNARANKYWEARLTPGHTPSDGQVELLFMANESKIENFIRTKYESKRWVMEGGIPDPSTLDTGETNVQSVEARQPTTEVRQSRAKPIVGPGQDLDLFGPSSSITQQPVRSQSTSTRPPKTSESLLGFDFLGASTSTPPRPSSAAPTVTSVTAPSRPDLKQSILSLYANSSAPVTAANAEPQTRKAAVAPALSLADDFSGLQFGSLPDTGSTSTLQMNQRLQNPDSPKIGNGKPPNTRGLSSSSGFGQYESAVSSPAIPSVVPRATAKPHVSETLDLLDSPSLQSASPTGLNPDYNVTAKSLADKPTANKSVQAPAMDAWAGNPWGTDPVPSSNAAPSQSSASFVAPAAPQTTKSGQEDGWEWHSSNRTVPSAEPIALKDDDFGGWESSAAPVSESKSQPSQSSQPSQPSRPLASQDDLFSNVWE